MIRSEIIKGASIDGLKLEVDDDPYGESLRRPKSLSGSAKLKKI